MFGVWSRVSHRWCFGIMEQSRDKAFAQLKSEIGPNAYKTRFEMRKLTKGEVEEIEALSRQHEAEKREREESNAI